MNAVIGSILESLRAIQIVYEPTIEIFKGDRANTGDSKELSVNEFIQSYLTTDYRVKKGKIYSINSESNNIDCVVLAPNHPNIITPKREVILAEGVYVAIEVKPDITTLTEKSEFNRALKQVESIKKLERDVQRLDLFINKNNKPKYFEKIPSIIFSKKSSDFDKIIEFIRNKVEGGELNPEELPDIIFSIEKGTLYYCPHFQHTSYYNMLNPIQKKIFKDEVFMEIKPVDNEEHINLLIFILLFLNFEKPHIPISDFFIKKYLKLEGLKVQYRFYTLKDTTEIFSELIRNQSITMEEVKEYVGSTTLNN